MRVRFQFAGFIALLLCGACSSQPPPAANQSTSTVNTSAAQTSSSANAPSQSARTDASTAAPAHATSAPASSGGGGGEPIDTSKYDADIERLQKRADQKGSKPADRNALGEAYLARAQALTAARQYRAALGDYRRTLKYEPDNQEAQEMSARIISIMQSMGRDVPAEGAEPTPLPFKK